MCETKTIRVSLSLISLVAASFCIYQAHTEFRVEHHSEIKCQGPSGSESFPVNVFSGQVLFERWQML